MTQVLLKEGKALGCGTKKDYKNILCEWRDDEAYTYWFPACDNFENIDAIVKLQSASYKKSNVAYLQFTVAEEHKIDGKRLQEMNDIFFPDHVKNAGDTEPPIYIAVCPDRKSCQALVLELSPEVTAARETCRIFVGYYTQYPYGIAADGPSNDVPPKKRHVDPPYKLRNQKTRTKS